jgi:hypothetical protein
MTLLALVTEEQSIQRFLTKARRRVDEANAFGKASGALPRSGGDRNRIISAANSSMIVNG